MPKFSFGKPKMGRDAVLADMRDCIIRAAGPRDWNDGRASWLGRAARRLGISHGRATSIFYGKARTIPADEYLRIKAEIEAIETATEAARENHDATERAFLAARRAMGAAADDLREPQVSARGRGAVTSPVVRSPR